METAKHSPDVVVTFKDVQTDVNHIEEDSDKVSIKINPSIPDSNHPCKICLEGIEAYDNCELRIYTLAGHLKSVIKNARMTNDYTFGQSGIHIIELSVPDCALKVEPLKVIVR